MGDRDLRGVEGGGTRNPMHQKRSGVELIAPNIESAWHDDRSEEGDDRSDDGWGMSNPMHRKSSHLEAPELDSAWLGK